jgi:formiminoglutamate deiminase
MTSIHFDQALLPDGWARDVRIDVDSSGWIRDVEPGARATGPRHDIGLPGLANVHSHAFQRAMAGLTETAGDGDSFWSWREQMYRFTARLDPEQLRAIAALAYAEMLESGFTHVAEFHYLHHDPEGRPYASRTAMSDAVLDAAADVGIGITLLPVFYARSDFGGAQPTRSQRRFVNDADAYLALLEELRSAHAGQPAVVAGLALHSLRAVTPRDMHAVLPHAGTGPIHIHVAEQAQEVESCVAWSGLPPVAWLLDHAHVDRRWCLVHATHLEDDERRRLAASGAVAGLCPVTEANLGDGVFPLAAFVDDGGQFGVGSDSNVQISAAGELRLLEYGQRLTHWRRNCLARNGASSGRVLFESAARAGSRACGVAAGRIAPGARADLIALDGEHPSLTARSGDALLDSWIMSAGDDAVVQVWCGGRQVVADGRHLRGDELRRDFRQVLRGLLDVS